MSDGIFEVRVRLPNRIARVLFCFSGKSLVLLHGFIKKTESTPRAELDLARKRMAQLME